MEGSDLLQDLIANNSAEQQVTPKSSACSKRVSLADDSHAPKPSTSSSKKASTSDDRHSSKSSENVKKAKSSDSSSFKQLAEIMTQGFQSLQGSIEKMGHSLVETISSQVDANIPVVGVSDHDVSFNSDDPPELDDTEDDLFLSLGKDFNVVSAGPAVSAPIAKLVNIMLSCKTNSEAAKERVEKYSKLKPANVAYTGVPKMNKQIWSLTNRKTHLRDIQAQDVQSSLLLSSIPIIKTLETLNEVREGRADVDLTEVIRTLADSVALIGSANVGLVTMRKALIKEDLPDNLKPICAKDTEFTPELLFGEDLPKQLKDLGETTKLFGGLKRKYVQFGTRRGRLQSYSYGIHKDRRFGPSTGRGFRRGKFFQYRERGAPFWRGQSKTAKFPKA